MTKTFPECSLYKPDEAFIKPALPGGKLRNKTPLNAMVGKIVVDVGVCRRGIEVLLLSAPAGTELRALSDIKWRREPRRATKRHRQLKNWLPERP